jgi:hypothetical protein
MPCAVNLPMVLRRHGRESLQMAMSQDKCPQLKPSHVHHSITGMIVHNDPGGAFFVQGRAPLPVFWAPMPLPGLLQTSSSFADGMRATLARSEGSGAIFVFSSFRLFVGADASRKVRPLPHQPIRAPCNYRQCGGTCVKGFHGQQACCTDWMHTV